MKDYTNHREFYLNVREYYNLSQKEWRSENGYGGEFTKEEKERLQRAIKAVEKELTEFTKQEIESLPFKI